jgi:hypothetical protein
MLAENDVVLQLLSLSDEQLHDSVPQNLDHGAAHAESAQQLKPLLAQWDEILAARVAVRTALENRAANDEVKMVFTSTLLDPAVVPEPVIQTELAKFDEFTRQLYVTCGHIGAPTLLCACDVLMTSGSRRQDISRWQDELLAKLEEVNNVFVAAMQARR